MFDIYFNCFNRYNGNMPDDLYYYPSVIAHDSDSMCNVIWMTIVNCILLQSFPVMNNWAIHNWLLYKFSKYLQNNLAMFSYICFRRYNDVENY